jgi:membrane-bound inhibitor of C-type lysozyme
LTAARFAAAVRQEFAVRRLLLVSAVGLLTLSGCATRIATEATTAPVTYACKAGKRFTATYPAKGDKAVVSAGGLTKALPLVRSASGARYATGKFELWGKGDAARLTGFPGGPYIDCQAH